MNNAYEIIKRILFILFSSFIGLNIFLIAASFFQWINPIWWSAFEFIMQIYFALPPIMIGLTIFIILNFIIEKINLTISLSYWFYIIAGIIQGFTIYPCEKIRLIIQNAMTSWVDYSLHFQLLFSNIITGIISGSILILIYIIIVIIRKFILKGSKNYSNDLI